VLVQPATIARWHRDGLRRRWGRRSGRKPGGPPVDSHVRALIRRMAIENRLWGAPRIHGELLKLGIVISERTVSRYLRDRRPAPSQTWRTSLANHFRSLPCPAMVTSSCAPNDDEGFHSCDEPLRPIEWVRGGPCNSVPDAVVNWVPSVQSLSLDWVGQNHPHLRSITHGSSGKYPPRAARRRMWPPVEPAELFSPAHSGWPLGPDATTQSPGAESRPCLVLSFRHIGRERRRKTDTSRSDAEAHRCHSYAGRNIGDVQVVPLHRAWHRLPVSVHHAQLQRLRDPASLHARCHTLIRVRKRDGKLVILAEYRRVPLQVRAPPLYHSERSRP